MLIPVRALSDFAVAFVACGEEYSACITRARNVYSWGLNNVGQLGSGDYENKIEPFLLPEMSNRGVESLTCSQSQAFAVCADGYFCCIFAVSLLYLC